MCSGLLKILKLFAIQIVLFLILENTMKKSWLTSMQNFPVNMGQKGVRDQGYDQIKGKQSIYSFFSNRRFFILVGPFQNEGFS